MQSQAGCVQLGHRRELVTRTWLHRAAFRCTTVKNWEERKSCKPLRVTELCFWCVKVQFIFKMEMEATENPKNSNKGRLKEGSEVAFQVCTEKSVVLSSEGQLFPRPPRDLIMVNRSPPLSHFVKLACSWPLRHRVAGPHSQKATGPLGCTGNLSCSLFCQRCWYNPDPTRGVVRPTVLTQTSTLSAPHSELTALL